MNITCLTVLWSSLVLPFLALPSPGRAELTQPVAVKEWTVLVYLNGDNNLDSYGTRDMEEMQKIGSNAKVNIVVLRDTSDSRVSSKIFTVEKGKLSVAKDYGSNIDMGDWHNLVSFFQFAREKFPARHYMLDVWNHGSGWNKRRAHEPTRGISYDDGSGNHITTPQLGEALAEIRKLNSGKKVDLFGMDACLMQMAEVVHEIADSTDIVVGSEEVEPADGWAYDAFLGDLEKNPKMSAAELGGRIVRTYVDFYRNQPDMDVQASAVDTVAFQRAMGSWNSLIQETTPLLPLFRSEILDGFNSTQHYYTENFLDMVALVSMFKERVGAGALKAGADAAIADLKKSVVANAVLGEKLAHSNGLSIWAPLPGDYSNDQASYAELKWARDGAWRGFLEALANPTTPVVTIDSVQARGLSGEGFATAGSDVEVSVHLENESKIPGENIGVGIGLPPGFVLKSGTARIDLTPANGMKAIATFIVRPDLSVKPGDYSLTLELDVPGLGRLSKPVSLTLERDFTVENHLISTPHDYPPGQELEWKITHPGARGIRVHFAKFVTERDYDIVYLYDAQGNIAKVLAGDLGAFWSEEIPGDTVTIRFTSDASENFYGFDIDKIAY